MLLLHLPLLTLLVSLLHTGEFVVTQKHPLEPPTQRDMTERVFRPPGTVVPKALKDLKSTKVVVDDISYTVYHYS